jgi:serine/threonine-protein kinase
MIINDILTPQYIGESNRFKVLEILGEGGMGKVYKAYDNQLKELVAIKSISKKLNTDKAIISIFLNEAKTSLQITHKNVIRVRDILFFDNSYYLVMQFIDGFNLQQWMRINRDIKLRDAKKMYYLIRPIFEALEEAHKYTIHRDIKPANIMLDNNDNIYLMDFGIATVIKGSQIQDVIKKRRKIVGTPSYMSPEQIKGVEDIDNRSDIYSMGVVYYELLTNQKPSKDNIILASYFNESVTPLLDSIILKMLASKPNERYSSCSEIINDMDLLFSGALQVENKRTIKKPHSINYNNFVLVSEGYFHRGSGIESKIDVEKPRAKIYLDNYYIGIYPVTNSEYLEFLKVNGLKYSELFETMCQEKPNHPVTEVSWDDAMLYCDWIGGSLPTEAEWEKASKGTRSRIYPWGNHFKHLYCNIENSIGQTVAVDNFSNGVSQYGCYQMSGNIWEWCLDDFVADFYQKRKSKIANPISKTDSDIKVLRGGGFNFVKSAARSSYRYYAKRNHKDITIGFRVVLKSIGEKT